MDERLKGPDDYPYVAAPPRKRKKRRKKRYGLKFLILLIILGAAYYVMHLDTFNIDAIYIDGNSYYTAEQVIENAGVELSENIFFDVRPSKIKRKLTKDPYVMDASVKRKLPNEITITIQEREEAAAILYGDTYVVIDENGLILRQTEEEPKVTIFIGLTLKNINVGSAVKAEESYMLTDTLKVLHQMRASDIYFKKVDLSGVLTKAYIYDRLVVIGSPEAVSEQLESGNLQLVLSNIYNQGIERGTITVSTDGTCAFSGVVEE